MCLDVSTSWNSIYLMLVFIEKFPKLFKHLEVQDGKFIHDYEFYVAENRRLQPIWILSF